MWCSSGTERERRLHLLGRYLLVINSPAHPGDQDEEHRGFLMGDYAVAIPSQQIGAGAVAVRQV